MSALRVSISVIALLVGGWLVSDGIRALATGDYLTARTGPRAGQLGPWARLVAKAGFDPRGTPIKALHIALGGVWLIGLAFFLTGAAAGWWLLIICSVGSLWYLPLGTVLSLIELSLLLTSAARFLK